MRQYLIESKIGLTTKSDETGHIHTAMVNEDGDGKTIGTKGADDHVHNIFQWLVQPAAGHVHNLEEV